MSGGAIAMVLDLTVLLCLAVTIFYAVKLTNHLSAFRAQRRDFDAVIGELSRNIVQANTAIRNLKETGQHTGEELQSLIGQAKGLIGELQIMTESGDSLARRLENAAQGKASAVHGGIPDRPYRKPAARAAAKQEPEPPSDDFSFFIQDRDYGEEEGPVGEEDAGWDDYGDDTPESDFESQAERDLFRALQQNRNKSGGR